MASIIYIILCCLIIILILIFIYFKYINTTQKNDNVKNIYTAVKEQKYILPKIEPDNTIYNLPLCAYDYIDDIIESQKHEATLISF